MLGREVFTAGVIVLIVATIAAAGRLGISPALGVFAAGVVVGDTEFIHEIGDILRPFRGFLSVLFFASIGMLLDPSFLRACLSLVLAAVAAVIVINVAAAYPRFGRPGRCRARRCAPRSQSRRSGSSRSFSRRRGSGSASCRPVRSSSSSRPPC